MIIGGKYVDIIGDVMKQVNSLTNGFGGKKPLAVFLISNNYKEVVKIDVDYGFDRFKANPVMVKLCMICEVYIFATYSKVQISKNKVGGSESEHFFTVYCPGCIILSSNSAISYLKLL